MLLCAHLFPEHGDIEAVWWLLTLCFEPEAPVAKLRRQLDGWGRRLRTLVAKAGSSRERLQTLTTFMAEDLGFRATPEEYYDPKNSLLSDLIETRLGIPISLAMLYVIVGRRATCRSTGSIFRGISSPVMSGSCSILFTRGGSFRGLIAKRSWPDNG